MTNLRISEIQIVPLKPRNGLVGLASMIVNECLYMGQMRIMANRNGGFRIDFPYRQGLKDERVFQVYHPINSETKAIIEEAILAKFYSVTGFQGPTDEE
jgi:DNA-binding cell septation regulator SpoVG